MVIFIDIWHSYVPLGSNELCLNDANESQLYARVQLALTPVIFIGKPTCVRRWNSHTLIRGFISAPHQSLRRSAKSPARSVISEVFNIDLIFISAYAFSIISERERIHHVVSIGRFLTRAFLLQRIHMVKTTYAHSFHQINTHYRIGPCKICFCDDSNFTSSLVL